MDFRRAGLPDSTLCILEWFLFVCLVFFFFFPSVASVPLSFQISRLSSINIIAEVGSSRKKSVDRSLVYDSMHHVEGLRIGILYLKLDSL